MVITVYIWVGGSRYPSRGILAPTPYSKPQSRGKMPKTNKNCFSEHRTTVIFQFMVFYGLNSIYQVGSQDTPAGVSWPPPLIPGQKVDFFSCCCIFLLITHKNCFSEHLTTVLPVFDVLMVISVYIWVGAKIPQPGYLDPPPTTYSRPKIVVAFFVENIKNCFSEHLTLVLPVYDVLMVITVYIWVGAKIPQPGYLGPHPLFQATK